MIVNVSSNVFKVVKSDKPCFNEKEWQMVQLVVNNCHEVNDGRYDEYLSGLEGELLLNHVRRIDSHDISSTIDQMKSDDDDDDDGDHIKNNDQSNDSYATLFESDISLLTGKTHQIRLQLSALGSPIIGDTRYHPVSGLLDQGDDCIWGNGMQLFGPDPMRYFH